MGLFKKLRAWRRVRDIRRELNGILEGWEIATDQEDTIKGIIRGALQQCDLKTVNIPQYSLEEIPNFGSLSPSVKFLYLRRNNFSKLGNIIYLTSLEHLHLSQNNLTEIEESIEELKELTDLDLSNNRLTYLPPSISSLDELVSLSLAENNFALFPEPVKNLTGLKVLDIRNNSLTTIDNDIFSKLGELQDLDLSGNQLSSLPESIQNLSKLTELSLKNCGITSLPNWFYGLRNDIRIHLGGNPLDDETRTRLAGSGLNVTYNMAAFEVSNDANRALSYLFNIAQRSQFSSLANSEPTKTFLSTIQNSVLWKNKELFNKYIKPTLQKMLCSVLNDEQDVIKDIKKSAEGCATNGTGIILNYYLKYQIEELKGAAEKIDYHKIKDNKELFNDFCFISLIELSNQLINDYNLSGDRAEMIADLLRIISGETFQYKGNEMQISNPISISNISQYSLQAGDKAAKLLLDKLVKSDKNGKFICREENKLEIDSGKLEEIAKRYISIYGDIYIDSIEQWSSDLAQILRNEKGAEPDSVEARIKYIYNFIFVGAPALLSQAGEGSMLSEVDELEKRFLNDPILANLTTNIPTQLKQEDLKDIGSKEEYLQVILEKIESVLGEKMKPHCDKYKGGHLNRAMSSTSQGSNAFLALS